MRKWTIATRFENENLNEQRAEGDVTRCRNANCGSFVQKRVRSLQFRKRMVRIDVNGEKADSFRLFQFGRWFHPPGLVGPRAKGALLNRSAGLRRFRLLRGFREMTGTSRAGFRWRGRCNGLVCRGNSRFCLRYERRAVAHPLRGKQRQAGSPNQYSHQRQHAIPRT